MNDCETQRRQLLLTAAAAPLVAAMPASAQAGRPLRANPGRLSDSSGGNGSAAHITFEYLKLRTQVFMPHIPYRGSALAITDLTAGQVDATFTGAPAVLPPVRCVRWHWKAPCRRPAQRRLLPPSSSAKYRAGRRW